MRMTDATIADADANVSAMAVTSSRLTLERESKTILQDINLAIPSGAVVGLVGRNGAGKTSLLRCLTGLMEPTSGTSSLLGCPSKRLSDAVRERLGYVAQTPDLFEWMEVFQMIKTVGQAYARWDETRALALAVQLDLPVGRTVRNLSGGEQQKLSVVLALAHDPDLLLLDEPVSSLDPMARREFMRALFASPLQRDAKANGEPRERTVLISSHLLSDLERVVTHVAFIRDGRLQCMDAWDAMLEHLRLVAPGKDDGWSGAVVWNNQKTGQRVVDTRRAPGDQAQLPALTLDELFQEFNS